LSSKEERGRLLRYLILDLIFSLIPNGIILTGHNQSDWLENTFIKLGRGVGAGGLINKRPFFLSPLIGIQKGKILTILDELNIHYCIDQSNKENVYKRNQVRKFWNTEKILSGKGLFRSWKNLFEDRIQREKKIKDRLDLKNNFSSIKYCVWYRQYDYMNFTLTEFFRTLILESVFIYRRKKFCNKKITSIRAEFSINKLKKLNTNDLKIFIDSLSNAWGLPATNFYFFKRFQEMLSKGKVQNSVENRYLMLGKGRDKNNEYLVIRPANISILWEHSLPLQFIDFNFNFSNSYRLKYKKNHLLRTRGYSKKLSRIFQEYGVSKIDRPFVGIYKKDINDTYIDLISLNHIREEWPELKSLYG
jgi:hypothetical protein